MPQRIGFTTGGTIIAQWQLCTVAWSVITKLRFAKSTSMATHQLTSTTKMNSLLNWQLRMKMNWNLANWRMLLRKLTTSKSTLKMMPISVTCGWLKIHGRHHSLQAKDTTSAGELAWILKTWTCTCLTGGLKMTSMCFSTARISMYVRRLTSTISIQELKFRTWHTKKWRLVALIMSTMTQRHVSLDGEHQWRKMPQKEPEFRMFVSKESDAPTLTVISKKFLTYLYLRKQNIGVMQRHGVMGKFP